jgi:hypothetical protein
VPGAVLGEERRVADAALDRPIVALALVVDDLRVGEQTDREGEGRRAPDPPVLAVTLTTAFALCESGNTVTSKVPSFGKLLVFFVIRRRADPSVGQNQPVVGMLCTSGTTSGSSFAMVPFVIKRGYLYKKVNDAGSQATDHP